MGCLVGRAREREREREIVGLDCFSSGPPKLHLPKWGEKRSENVVQNFGLKCPLTQVSVVRFCFFFFFFFSFFFCASFASINSYFLETSLFCFLRCKCNSFLFFFFGGLLGVICFGFFFISFFI